MNEYTSFSEKCRKLGRSEIEEWGRIIQFLRIKEKRSESEFDKGMYGQVVEDMTLLFNEKEQLGQKLSDTFSELAKYYAANKSGTIIEG